MSEPLAPRRDPVRAIASRTKHVSLPTGVFRRPGATLGGHDNVSVLTAFGRLVDVADLLDHAVAGELADQPAAVVCDLSAAKLDQSDQAAARLAAIGRHAQAWPAVPVALAGTTPQLRAAIRRRSTGTGLLLLESDDGTDLTMTTPVSATATFPLPVTRAAPRVARDLTTQVLTGWGRRSALPTAHLLVSELVTNAVVHALHEIRLTLSADPERLRVMVHDSSVDLPRRRASGHSCSGRGLQIVAELSSHWGTLPTREGGKQVWAVVPAVPDPQPTLAHR